MNIPSLPTDNFYKFLTVGGLVLTIAVAMYLDATTRAFESTRAEYLVAERELDIDAKEAIQRAVRLVSKDKKWNEEAERLLRLSEVSLADYRFLYLDGLRRSQLNTHLKRADLAWSTYVNDLERKGQLVGIKRQHVNYLEGRLDNLMYSAPWFLAAGFILFAVGMGWWYYRHQRLQDKLLQFEVENRQRAKPQPKNAKK